MSFRGLMPHFFLALNNIPLSEYTAVYLLIYPTEGPFGCFQVVAVSNEAAINICVQIFV